jgi:Nucleotidyltransferase domain
MHAADVDMTVGPIALSSNTAYPQVDAILRGMIGVHEMVFPMRVRAYYLVGSYHTGHAVPASDLDVIVVFRGSFLPGEEDASRDVNNHCSRISPVRLDAKATCEAQILSDGDPLLKASSLLLYGDDIRDQIPLRPAPEVDEEFGQYVGLLTALRGWPATMIYPLQYPDAQGEFFGYERQGNRVADWKWAEDDYQPGTRTLVDSVATAALLLVQMHARQLILSKHEIVSRYRADVNDVWAPFVGDIYTKCRTQWQYLIPKSTADRRNLRDLCRKTLAFENHVLETCRTYLLRRLASGEAAQARPALHALGSALFRDDETKAALLALSTHEQEAIRLAARDCLRRIQ